MANKKELLGALARIKGALAEVQAELAELKTKERSVFGGNLVRLRKARGMTQEGLALALGCSRPCLANMERGANKTTIDRLMQVCQVLDVTPNDLLLEWRPNGGETEPES